MKILDGKLQWDRLHEVRTSRSPLATIVELLWNSLDADTTNVSVTLNYSQFNGLEAIKVIHDGHARPHIEAPTAFQHLGGY